MAHSSNPTDTNAVEIGNPLMRDSLSTPNTIGGRVQLDENGNLIDNVATLHDNDQFLEYKPEVNVCGCTKFVMQVAIGVCVAAILLFIGISFGTGSPVCFAIGVIFLVTSIVLCVIHCCPCCQPVKGADE